MFKAVNKWLKQSKLAKQKTRLTDSNYAFLFDDVVPGHYVCFDCETTGLDRKKDRIITLSAIKIEHNEVLTSQSLNLVVKQPEEISKESIVIHQIRNVDVDNSEFVYNTEQEAVADFLEFIRGTSLVGYYLEFDVAMIDRVLKPWLGVGLPNPKIEVAHLYHEYAREQCKRSCIEPNIDLRFDSILKDLDIPNLGQHDAFNDALMTSLIYLKLQALKKGVEQP